MEYKIHNKLQHDVYEYIKYQKDRHIIDAEDLNMFVAMINSAIDKLNSKHPRCKPLKPDWHQFKKNNPSKTWVDHRLILPMITLEIYEADPI